MHIEVNINNLTDYLYWNKLSITDFSKKVDCTRTYLSSIINGRQVPSRRMARDIERATDGAIKAEDLLKIGRHEDPKPMPTEKLIQDKKQDNQDGNPDQ